MSDYLEWRYSTAKKMRASYDRTRPLTFWERIFGRRSTDTSCTFAGSQSYDDLMLGLLDVALNAFANFEPEPGVLYPYHLGAKDERS